MLLAGCPGPLPRISNPYPFPSSMSVPAPQAALDEAALQSHTSMPVAFNAQPPLLNTAPSSGTLSGGSTSSNPIIEATTSDAEPSAHSVSNSMSDLEGISGSPQSVLRDRADPDAAASKGGHVPFMPGSTLGGTRPSPKPAAPALQQLKNAIAEHPEETPQTGAQMAPPVGLEPRAADQGHICAGSQAGKAAEIPPLNSVDMAAVSGASGTGRYRLTSTRSDDAAERKEAAEEAAGMPLTGVNHGRGQLGFLRFARSEKQLLKDSAKTRSRVAQLSSQADSTQAQATPAVPAKGKADGSQTFCFKHDLKMPARKAVLQCWGA